MTTSRFPEIVLTCRNGHQFRTKARGGTTVRCPTCKAPKHVPADRPRTAREVAALKAAGSDGQDQDHEMAARWAAEPEWDGRQLPDRPGRPGDACLECGGPLTWEPGRTWTDCDTCAEGHGGVSLPSAVIRHYERRAEVAVRAEPDKSAQRAMRARLRAMKETAQSRVGEWLDTIADDERYDRVQFQRQARELGAMLRGYLPEIGEAQDERELGEVWREVDGLVTSDQGKALMVEYEQTQQRFKRQHEAQQRAAEYAQRQRELAEQQVREQREAERAANAREIEQARQQRKAITSRTTTVPIRPVRPGTVVLAEMLERWNKNRAGRERKLAEYGPCGYEHKNPESPARRYWIVNLDWQGNDSGYAAYGSTSAVVCKAHFAMADEWIEEQAASIKARGYTQIRAAYTELT